MLYFLIHNPYVAIGFVIGALSGLAGYVGMFVSVGQMLEQHKQLHKVLTKLLIFHLSQEQCRILSCWIRPFGLVGYYWFLYQKLGESQGREIIEAMIALSFGASLISIFARLGGGIFTKGADVGADLVGKIEAGIPEDDPRNPAVIADNVGDNVGDCAGMAADLFETYAVTIVGTMV